MQYEGVVIRPPSEENSIIVQVTAGCSHNKCTFCGAYKGKRFSNRLTVDRVQFYSNHTSNYLPLTGRLQRDKDRLLATLDGALSGTIELIDEEWRGL